MLPLVIAITVGLMTAQATQPRKDIPTIAKAANGAVVSIIMSDKEGRPIAQGSGFVVSKDGRIVTNYHVIRSGSSAIVKLPNGAFFVVDGVLAFDDARDIAVIKAHGENFRTVTLGDSSRVQVGDEIIAIGNPLSLESTVSNGIVSAVRNIEEEGGKFLQITAPISPGSSGGPLFNVAGEVVGITTSGVKGGENLNFAIPVNDTKSLLDRRPSRLHELPNEAMSDGPSSRGYFFNTLVCLDSVIDTVEIPFKHLGHEGCLHFVVRFPLSPEDADLLGGRLPEDDELMGKMEVQSMSATTMITTKLLGEKSDVPTALIGAIWSSFERNRDAFCSQHPKMFVFHLKLDGSETPPEPCSTPKPNKWDSYPARKP